MHCKVYGLWNSEVVCDFRIYKAVTSYICIYLIDIKYGFSIRGKCYRWTLIEYAFKESKCQNHCHSITKINHNASQTTWISDNSNDHNFKPAKYRNLRRFISNPNIWRILTNISNDRFLVDKFGSASSDVNFSKKSFRTFRRVLNMKVINKKTKNCCLCEKLWQHNVRIQQGSSFKKMKDSWANSVRAYNISEFNCVQQFEFVDFNVIKYFQTVAVFNLQGAQLSLNLQPICR